MILDTLNNASVYTGLLPGLDLAFDFLRSEQARTAENGRYDLDGDRVFALVQTYTTRPFDQGVWEAHLKYADVQCMVIGREQMGYAPINAMTEVQPYDAAKDFALFDGQGVMLPFSAGMFILFLPQDVHRPGIADSQLAEVRKVVVKVRLND